VRLEVIHDDGTVADGLIVRMRNVFVRVQQLPLRLMCLQSRLLPRCGWLGSVKELADAAHSRVSIGCQGQVARFMYDCLSRCFDHVDISVCRVEEILVPLVVMPHA
jgi:hypothetical protein